MVCPANKPGMISYIYSIHEFIFIIFLDLCPYTKHNMLTPKEIQISDTNLTCRWVQRVVKTGIDKANSHYPLIIPAKS